MITMRATASVLGPPPGWGGGVFNAPPIGGITLPPSDLFQGGFVLTVTPERDDGDDRRIYRCEIGPDAELLRQM